MKQVGDFFLIHDVLEVGTDIHNILYHMLCGKARKSEAIFFTLDDLRLLRDFPKGGSLRFYVRKKKKGIRPFRLIKSTCGWGLLLRGGAH